ncbi:hypothetical protein B6S12_00445 [Helicobacter valdiviensis]|uniref:UPF0056 membrane protein n=1 Tax=Helicobacter valdiviensis TaxID=1458358 RepID=A0A2W6MXJ5_9HELI|nr:MarC family protein [Helicobacter valdiviensis]PZT49097.1 hypothetical protein B6S12_00445 [Helicobacter valdiviensis]
MDIYSILLGAVAIIAVLNPFGNLPQFISMTDELDKQMRQGLFRNILYTSFIIVIVFLLVGPFFMRYLFRVDLNDLKIAGGLLLILVSLKSLLFPPSKNDHHYENLNKQELLSHSVVPMAFPMLVGPGTLSTVIVLSEEKGMLSTIFSVFVAFIFMLVLFHFAATIERVVGKLVLHVLSRIVLVFIMAMGSQMILVGIKSSF